MDGVFGGILEPAMQAAAAAAPGEATACNAASDNAVPDRTQDWVSGRLDVATIGGEDHHVEAGLMELLDGV